jgi:hypothetical protein
MQKISYVVQKSALRISVKQLVSCVWLSHAEDFLCSAKKRFAHFRQTTHLLCVAKPQKDFLCSAKKRFAHFCQTTHLLCGLATQKVSNIVRKMREAHFSHNIKNLVSAAGESKRLRALLDLNYCPREPPLHRRMCF